MSRDMVVFWTVAAARLLLPLLIFRYPLPAILGCLALDAVDQTVFQTYTTLNLDGYQGYDKALDIYYLTIAYISTMRNWKDHEAFRVGQFLYYYRLLGVMLFELAHRRWLLLAFPNTFEYFFILYEIVRLRWDPRRIGKLYWGLAAALIWVFIKLPQEYWIHIARRDTSDFLKESVFGVSPQPGWGDALTNRPLVTLVIAVLIAVVAALVWWLWTERLPPSIHKVLFAADPLPGILDEAKERRAFVARYDHFLSMALLEKTIMVAFVCIIFAQVLPDVRASNLDIAVGVAVLVAINAFLGLWTARRATGLDAAALNFVVLGPINLALVLLADRLLPLREGTIDRANTLFFVLLLTLIVTLYDMYRPIYEWRFSGPARAEREAADCPFPIPETNGADR